MMDYFKKKLRSYEVKLRELLVNKREMLYEQKCLFILAFNQYIEAAYMVENDISDGAFDIDNFNSWLRRRHRSVSSWVLYLREVVATIQFECYSPDCISDVDRFMSYDRLPAMVFEFNSLAHEDAKESLNLFGKATSTMSGS